MLTHFLAQLSAQKSLAVYGRGPAWLYAALALPARTQSPFYQFDARLGWVTPPSLSSGTPGRIDPIHFTYRRAAQATISISSNSIPRITTSTIAKRIS